MNNPLRSSSLEREGGLVQPTSLNVCISTIDAGIRRIIGRLPPRPRTSYIVGHQLRPNFDASSCLLEWDRFARLRPDIHRISLNSVGLSANRNALIEASDGDIILFSDDDVELCSDFSDSIIDAFERHPLASVITFRFEGGGRTKSLPRRVFSHNYFTAARVSSIEVAARRSILIANNIRFDTEFGLGTRNPSGEEFIFLTDCMKKGLSVAGVPRVIARHPQESSGTGFFKTREGIEAKGRMFRRVFGGAMSVPFIVAFALKKRREYKSYVSTYRLLKLMLKD